MNKTDKRKGLIAAYKKSGPMQRSSFWWNVGGVIVTVIGVVLTIVFFLVQERKPTGKIDSGTIKETGKVFFSFEDGIIPRIQIGDKGPIFNPDLLKFFEKLGLKAEEIEGEVKFTISILDFGGNLIAQIENNEWKLNPNNIFDRNYSDDAIEVKDMRGNIVLQARVASGILQFQGRLFDTEKKLHVLVKQVLRNGSWDGFLHFMDSPDQAIYQIEPLFKYPGDLHLGEFNRSQ